MTRATALVRTALAGALLLLPARDAAAQALEPASAAAPSTPPAPATPAPENAPPADFDRLDRNADGGIGRDEVPVDHALGTRFDELDSNGDGKLSRDEFARFG
jgi:hypothetical protein